MSFQLPIFRISPRRVMDFIGHVTSIRVSLHGGVGAGRLHLIFFPGISACSYCVPTVLYLGLTILLGFLFYC